MLRNRVFALSSVLALGMTAVACGSDDRDKGGDPPPPPPSSDRLAYSYLSGIALPGVGSLVDDECCVDFDGNGSLENGIGGILPLAEGFLDGVDLEEVIGGVFEDGTLSLVFKYNGPPEDISKSGATDLSLHLATSDSDWAARSTGEGVFTLGQELAVLKGATVRGGVLQAKSDALTLSINISGFLGDSDLGLPDVISLGLASVQIRAEITEEMVGGEPSGKIANTAALEDRASKPINYLTGGLTVGSVVELVNELFASCGEGPFLSIGEANTADEATITANYSTSSAPGSLCGAVGTVAPLVGAVSALLDIDTNKNDVKDALSIGIRVKMVGASVAQ